MADARWARLALEAGFLLAVAALLAVADVEPVWIAVVMLIAWVIVALLEWAAWHGEAHWASGRPPRYYVPQQPLPPRPPTRELPPFTRYPRAAPRESEAPTWIAPPELREQVLGWSTQREEAEPAEAMHDALQESTVEEPPPVPDEVAAEAAPVAAEPPVVDEPVPPREPRPGVAKPPPFPWSPDPEPPVAALLDGEAADDGVVVAEPVVEEAVAVVPAEPEHEELLEALAEPEPMPAEEPSAAVDEDAYEPVELSFVDEATFVEPANGDLAAAIAEHDSLDEPADPEPAPVARVEPPPPRAARHSIDPFP